MAGRYSRFHSNYILKKKHQSISTGTIWERDWVTIGAKHQLERGKRPFFGDSGFLYTINNVPTTKKRHDFGKWVGTWFYPDVENTQETVNSVEVNYLSNDIRDFVYYGSCTELIRSSMLNIIENFPPILTNYDNTVPFVFYREENGNRYKVLSPGLKMYNPFDVDLIHSDVDEKSVNINRFLAISFHNFEIALKINGDDNTYYFDEIESYEVVHNDYYHIESGQGITKEDYDAIHPESAKEFFHPIDYDLPEECNLLINTVDVNLKAINSENPTQYVYFNLKGYDFSEGFTFCLHSGRIKNDNGSVKTFSYGGGSTPTISASSIMPEIAIYPKENVKMEFYEKLDGFQRLLLREDTRPFYKNVFLTPYETETGMYYTNMDYIWPSQTIGDRWTIIDISSPLYYEYVDRLYKLGSSLDELWCDNLWRNMTHESIKNYDWTYKRTFVEGDEEDNVAGGQRMEHIIRIYGRLFDDLKRYIDGIKLTNNVTYDGLNNRPEAELSDKLNYMGWDVFSTIPLSDEEDLSDTVLDDAYINENDLKWFKPINNNTITAALEDNAFMRSLSLSSKYILKSKGTIDSIEMVLALFGMGNTENEKTFDITEKYHVVKPHSYTERLADDINTLYQKTNPDEDDSHIFGGLPLNITDLYNGKYIIPFYDNRRYYDGEFTFQSNGGWGANSDDPMEITSYMETLSYLKVVGNISELLSLNPYDVKREDIYYVIDLSDITKYDEGEEDLETYTHFFYCTDDVFVERYSSWRNIRNSGENFNQALYDKALYLDSLISTDVGNNPHVGYGNYDLGEEYLSYMKNPFTYALNNYSLSDNVREMMEDDSISFVINGIITDEMRDKCLNLIDKNGDIGKFFANVYRERNEKAEELKRIALCVDNADVNRLQNEIANLNAILNTVRYYINDKTLILTNKVGEETEETRIDPKTGEEFTYRYFKIPDLYKRYFFDTIFPYIMQVIPSTTILILKDFD